MPIEDKEQVEIIKGASSVLYGSAALSGVINVRTAYPGAEAVTRATMFGGVYDMPGIADGKWWGPARHLPPGPVSCTASVSRNSIRCLVVMFSVIKVSLGRNVFPRTLWRSTLTALAMEVITTAPVSTSPHVGAIRKCPASPTASTAT
ncbi:MAG: TonB-dependent receptor [Flavobacteriales bacterium]|nr:TonB-dependent receptor [Flavobacteriales bacterium]